MEDPAGLSFDVFEPQRGLNWFRAWQFICLFFGFVLCVNFSFYILSLIAMYWSREYFSVRTYKVSQLEVQICCTMEYPEAISF